MSYTISQKVLLNSSYGKWILNERIVPDFRYAHGHPSGYTDDLGIIADHNQWVDEVWPGYYSLINPAREAEYREWCETNAKHTYEVKRNSIYFSSEKDVTWFMLRWS